MNREIGDFFLRACEECGALTRYPRCVTCQRRDMEQRERDELASRWKARPASQPTGHANSQSDVVDEFSLTLAQVRRARETLPVVRTWSGNCWWCARELRETCGDTVTHQPVRERTETCSRHHAGLLELARILRLRSWNEWWRRYQGGNGSGDAA